MPRFMSLFLIMALFLLSSCATVDHPDVKVVETQPKVSKTIEQSSAATYKGLKRKIAIARFTNETKYGQSFFIDENNDRIGKQAVDILSSKLFETGKFIMLERADLAKINEELDMGNLESLQNNADYLIVGSITAFGRKDHSEVGIFSRVKKQIAFAKVHVRLIDVYTGQLIYSEEGEGEAFSEAGTVFGVGDRAGYDSSLNDRVLDAAITNLASNIIENLMDKPWRAYILGYEDNNLIISGGKSQNIKPGSTFKVVKAGKKVKNPQTNMFITLPGQDIATIEAVACLGDVPENEVTLCKIVKGDLTTYISKKDFSKLYIEEM